MPQDRVLIVGAGLAGLCAALELQSKGIPSLILEASDAPGGRVRTDELDGFLLDRGFQVYLTAYPEGLRVLDYPALEFKAFAAGAMVRLAGSFQKIADPWRHRGDLLASVTSPIGTFRDKLKLRGLRKRLMSTSIDAILEAENHTTMGLLKQEGFAKLIDRFFRPFLGGIMLDSSLMPSSRMFEFVFKMMSEGDTVVPARGMGEIPKQLAGRLPADTIRYNQRVTAISRHSVTLASGETIPGGAVLVATDGAEAARLAGVPPPRWRSVTCSYYEAPEPPLPGPWLILNGNNQWPINNIAVMSEVAPAYAPPGKALLSISVLGKPTQTEHELQTAVTAQLERWFGKASRDWRHLRTYRIPHAQPETMPKPPKPASTRLASGVYAAGDFQVMPSIQFAMLAGRNAAEAITADLTGTPQTLTAA
jgi:phytoene dehydrogenase-like protein